MVVGWYSKNKFGLNGCWKFLLFFCINKIFLKIINENLACNPIRILLKMLINNKIFCNLKGKERKKIIDHNCRAYFKMK